MLLQQFIKRQLDIDIWETLKLSYGQGSTHPNDDPRTKVPFQEETNSLQDIEGLYYKSRKKLIVYQILKDYITRARENRGNI